MRDKQLRFAFVMLVCVLIGCMTANGVVAKLPVHQRKPQKTQQKPPLVQSIPVPESLFQIFYKEIVAGIYDQQLQDTLFVSTPDRAYGINFQGKPIIQNNGVIVVDFLYKKNIQDPTKRVVGSVISAAGEGVIKINEAIGYGQMGMWVIDRTKNVPILSLMHKSKQSLGSVVQNGQWFSWINNVLRFVPEAVQRKFKKYTLFISIVAYLLLGTLGEKIKDIGISVGTKPSSELTYVRARICKIRCP